MSATGRMLRRAATAASALAVVALAAGCSFAPDPADVDAQAQRVFDRVVAVWGAADTAVLRTVEVLPSSTQTCADDGSTQTARTARATLGVTSEAEDADVQLELAESEFVDDGFAPADDAADEERAWVSEDGVLVTLTDADPVLVLAVFTPCLAG